MNYESVREKMKIGDLIAFGGNGFISETIKKVTGSPVSHVGAVLYSYVAGQRLVQVIESTSIGDGFAGVQINRLSDHIRDYDGEMWWYPLNQFSRDNFKEELFTRFMLKMKGRLYDPYQAVMSALDFIPDTKEDLDRLFCSELIAEAYERAGLIHGNNASEMTPADVCGFNNFYPVINLKKN